MLLSNLVLNLNPPVERPDVRSALTLMPLNQPGPLSSEDPPTTGILTFFYKVGPYQGPITLLITIVGHILKGKCCTSSFWR